MDAYCIGHYRDAGVSIDSTPFIELLPDSSMQFMFWPGLLDSVVSSKSGVWERFDLPADFVYKADKCQLFSGRGSWDLKPPKYHDYWQLSIHVERIYPVGDSTSIAYKPHHRSFRLRNESPPYEIFEWVTDPDSWRYVTFNKTGTDSAVVSAKSTSGQGE
jgi:hypothetical protein